MQKTQANYLDLKAEWKTDTRFNGWQSDPIANVGLSVRIANVGTFIAYCQRCAPFNCSLRYTPHANVFCTYFYLLSRARSVCPEVAVYPAAYPSAYSLPIPLPIRRLSTAYLPPIDLLAMQPPKNQL